MDSWRSGDFCPYSEIVPPDFDAHLQRHCRRLIASHRRWTGRDLAPGLGTAENPARAVFDLPCVVVSHGTEPDPILNFGNQTALTLWEMTWEELTSTPSRLTAEPMLREERARLLEQVTTHGYIDDYAGIRISKSGKRFRIEQATVWNLVDEDGALCGQAATFSHWTML